MGLDMFLFAIDREVPLNLMFITPENLAEDDLQQWESLKFHTYYNDNLGKDRFYKEVGYWRKANSIHGWFVDNIQNGNDDCQRYELTKEKLEELRKLCVEILNNGGGETLLPTRDGYLFGTLEYDKDYYQDLRTTIDIIKNLESFDFEKQRLIYMSWW